MSFIHRSSTLLFVAVFASLAHAQDGSTSIFQFLRLPTSAHTMALGGYNITLPDDDASLLHQNPALMADASDGAIALSMMTYMKGSKAGTASWTSGSGERGTWGVGAQFVGYGNMKETTVEGLETGTFSALDLALTGGYAYQLTEHVAGGASGKFLYSKYGAFTSVALAVDLGLNYYDEDKDLSVSVVAANLGGQVKSFADHRESLPFDLRLGVSKRLEGAPFRFSVTMVDLTRWRSSDYYSMEGKVKRGRILTNHFVLGADILFSEQFYASVGMNMRRAFEMKAAGGSHGAGLSFGAGLTLKRLKIHAAYAKYHLSMPSLMLTAQLKLKN